MKILIAAAVLAASAAPTLACNSEMLSVIDWEVTEHADDVLFPYKLGAEIEYVGDKPYRMIHAGVMLNDVLGKPVGQVNLERDQQVAPGDKITASGQVKVDNRLAKLNRNDVESRTCVWSIVYEDGTKEEF